MKALIQEVMPPDDRDRIMSQIVVEKRDRVSNFIGYKDDAATLRFICNRALKLKNWECGKNDTKKCPHCDIDGTRELSLL